MRVGKIIFILLLLTFSGSIFAQQKSRKENFKENHSPFGRRKKEKKNQKAFSRRGGLLKRGGNQRGNANLFASRRILGRKNLIESIFGVHHSNNASLRKTKPASRHDERTLFKRQRTSAKNQHARIQQKQRRSRESTRKRGNVLFQKKKR
jgi:hypothetical protein